MQILQIHLNHGVVVVILSSFFQSVLNFNFYYYIMACKLSQHFFSSLSIRLSFGAKVK